MLGLGLEGKVALITGGGSGIGEGTARVFAQAGAKVVVVDRVAENAERVTAEISRGGGEAIAVIADACIVADAERMVAAAVERFGGLDCAVNCAGGSVPNKPLLERTEEEWRGQIDLNLMSAFFSMQAEIKAMLARGGGAIVNISSGAGLRADAHMAPYNAGKFGVIGLTRSAAIDYAKQNIRVNAVCPGLINTPKARLVIESGVDFSPLLAALPMGRMGEPSEIGNANVWLCSPLASFITGIALPVDGGYMA